MGTINDIDPDIIERLKSLKPKGLPFDIVPLLPLIDEKLMEGVTSTAIADTIGLKRTTFRAAIASARRRLAKRQAQAVGSHNVPIAQDGDGNAPGVAESPVSDDGFN